MIPYKNPLMDDDEDQPDAAPLMKQPKSVIVFAMLFMAYEPVTILQHKGLCVGKLKVGLDRTGTRVLVRTRS